MLGKTVVFAKNQEHAQFIAERFNVNYPRYRGEFARVITFKTEYAQSLIDGFAQKDKAPHIAISVDMLDTGIDVPEVVNLVFFKLVRSKTKFWQMVAAARACAATCSALLGEAGAGGSAEDLARAAAESAGLGIVVRSLVGLDRERPSSRWPASCRARRSRPTRSSSWTSWSTT